MPRKKVSLLTAKIVPPKEPTPGMLAAGGKVSYDSWVREAGYAKDARIKEYDKQPVHIKARWEKLAADVFKAMMAKVI
jgi:hypothetical protein